MTVETCLWTANCLIEWQTKSLSYVLCGWVFCTKTVDCSNWRLLRPRLHERTFFHRLLFVKCKRNALPNRGLLPSGVANTPSSLLLEVLDNPVAFCSSFTKFSTERKGNTLKGRSVCVESVYWLFSTHRGLGVVQTTTKLTKRTRIWKRGYLTAFKKSYFCSCPSCSKRGLDYQECSKVKTDLRNGFFRHFYTNLCLVFYFWQIFLVETPIGKKNAAESVDIITH